MGDVAISTFTKSARNEIPEASTSKRRCSFETPPMRKNPPVIQDEERKDDSTGTVSNVVQQYRDNGVLCEKKCEETSEKIINAGDERTAKKINFDSIDDNQDKTPGSNALSTSTATNKHDGGNNNSNNNGIASSSRKSNTTSSKNETSAPAPADKNSNNDEDHDYIIGGDDSSDGEEEAEKEKKDGSGTSDRDPTLEEVGIFEEHQEIVEGQSKDTNGGSTKVDNVTDLEGNEGIEENKNVDHRGNNYVPSSAANLRHNNTNDATNVDRSVLVGGNGEKLCDTVADKDNLPSVTRTLDTNTSKSSGDDILYNVDVSAFNEKFLSTYSNGIDFHRGNPDDRDFLDMYPLEKEMLGNAIDDDFLNEFASTVPQLLESVVAMDGGIGRFTENRLMGTTRPAAIVDGLTASVTNMVVIFDIYRDGKWVWTAIHPFCRDDLRSLPGRMDDDKNNWSVLGSKSTNTLGDQAPHGTVFEWNHGTRRPNNFHLSTDSSDTRIYKFTASIISSNFSETFLASFEFVPQDMCVNHGESNKWRMGTKDDNSFVAKDESFTENPNILMVAVSSGMVAVASGTVPSDRIPQAKPTFYREKATKKKGERFHCDAVWWIPTDYFSTMPVHPPPADNMTTCTIVQKWHNLNSEGSLDGVLDPFVTDPIVRGKSTSSNSNTTSAVATIHEKYICSVCGWDKLDVEFANRQIRKKKSKPTCKLCISNQRVKKTSKSSGFLRLVAMQEKVSGAKIIGTAKKKKSAVYGDQDCVLKGIECILTQGGTISKIPICGRVHNKEEQQVGVKYLRNNMKKNLKNDATVDEGYVREKVWRLYLIDHLGYDSRHIPSSQGGQKKAVILGITSHSVIVKLRVWCATLTKEEAMSKNETNSHIICHLPQLDGTALLIDPDGSRVELNTSDVDTFKDWMVKITKPKTYGAGKERTHKKTANAIFTDCISDKEKKKEYNCEVEAAFLIRKVPHDEVATHRLHDEALLSSA